MSEDGSDRTRGHLAAAAGTDPGAEVARSCPLACSHPFVMGVLGGVAVALGASLLAAIQTGAPGGYGGAALLAGLGLSAGLFLASVGRCAVFAGTPAPFLSWFRAEMSTERFAGCLLSTLAGNILGALAVVWLAFVAGQYALAGSEVGQTALGIAAHKCALPFVSMLIRGFLGGALVALALWLAADAQSITDRAVAVAIPSVLLVACGFGHCVSDLYLVSTGLAIQAWEAVPGDVPAITVGALILRVFIPGALGGLLGAGFAVGALHWAGHVRTSPTPRQARPHPRRRPLREDEPPSLRPRTQRRQTRPRTRLDDEDPEGS